MVNIAYSKLQHLADALFLNHNPKKVHFAIMAGYTSYSDAGGDGSGHMMTVAGLISNTADWKELDKDWDKVLKWAHAPYLHMNKFVGHKKPFDNKKWERKELRDEFVSRLVTVMRKNIDFLALNVLPMNDYKVLNAEFKMKEARMTPFAVSGLGYMFVVEEWCRRNIIPWGQIEIFYEAGDDGGKEHFRYWCEKIFNKTPLPKPGVQDDSKEPDEYPLTPLQACDFVAWEIRRAEDDLKDGPSDTYTLRRSLEALDRLPQYMDHQRWTLGNLRKFCVKHGIKKRQTSSYLSSAADNPSNPTV